MAIELYEVNSKYIDYLVPHATHLFQNKQPAEVYKHKINKGNTTALAKRCNDFELLEKKCKEFSKGNYKKIFADIDRKGEK